MKNPTFFHKRNLFLPVFIATAITLLAGCSKSLNEDTSDMLGPGTFYKTKADFNAAVIPMYRYFSGAFRNAQGQQVMYAGDDITAIPGSNKAEFREWDLFDYNSASGWLESFAYKPYWQTIYAANSVLANIKGPTSTLPQEFLNEIAGEAHFMRGLSYYMLVRQFGGMPLITEKEQPTGKESRATVLENYKLIEEDLKFAAENLPPTQPNALGKATSGAAKTVLASLYLTWAGWPVKDESKYALSAQQATEVMKSGTYSLMDNFLDLWKVEYNRNNNEFIFAIMWDLDANSFINSIGQGYAPIDSKGWADGEAELTLFKRMPAGPRKDATYLTEFILDDGTTINWKDSQMKHPTFRKWTEGSSEKSGIPYYNGGQNVPLFRYAEVLLTFAEAEDMAKGEPDKEAYDAINKVRKRAGLSDLPTGLSKEQFRDSVVAERSYEFAGEFTRWFDEVRTETVEKFSGEMRDPDELSLINQPTKAMYISPIPKNEIEKDPNLIQNPEGNKIQ
jgi:hypothetical protein